MKSLNKNLKIKIMRAKEEILNEYYSDDVDLYTNIYNELKQWSEKLNSFGIEHCDSLINYDDIDFSYDKDDETFLLEYEDTWYGRCGDPEYEYKRCLVPIQLLTHGNEYLEVMVIKDREKKEEHRKRVEDIKRKNEEERKRKEYESDREKIRLLIEKYPELKNNILALEKINSK